MPAFRRGAALFGAALLLSSAPAAAQKSSSGDDGRPVLAVTLAAPTRAIYVAALDALERQGYTFRAKLLDEVLVTTPLEGTAEMGFHPMVAVELEERGDSTHVVISSVVMNKDGEPVGMDNEQAAAAMLMAEMSVSMAVDSALDRTAGHHLRPDPREKSEDFGYGSKNAVRVGGAAETGVANQRAYLARLRGPGGQTVRFRRLGSCCNFPTEYAEQGTGALDAYEITYDGQEAPQMIFIDFYTPPPAVQRAPEGYTLQDDGAGARSS
ncbi:hypothetical protein [Longimicrobium terrae]|uniref:Uncharacterized protein n=1 Tax=Longimicrobium terrae TaxID=1639882 RepID=A0A841H3I8_9BACT|nr:hypothetical protein [Longimicrobium terrae]MBB4638368.1 hypothetical protein [Longimicrobium terrae]MBB6072564.1 hypothetical protein [Longimicrobium terrae]NNC28657.1 hypothetical protein [Longimicrobium terrae]